MTRRLVLFSLVGIVLNACRKETVQASDILMSHIWSPYQTRIITYDTTVLSYYDSANKQHSVITTFHKDTTYNLEQCIQQSTYSFDSNGISHISNMCVAGHPSTDTVWSIQSNKVMQIVFIDDPVADAYFTKLFTIPTPTSQTGFYPVQNGSISQLSSSQFVVDQPSGETFDEGYYRNGVLVDSLVKLVCNRYIVFRSR